LHKFRVSLLSVSLCVSLCLVMSCVCLSLYLSVAFSLARSLSLSSETDEPCLSEDYGIWVQRQPVD